VDIEKWQARVNITQIPARLKDVYLKNPQSKEEEEFENSWLCNPFNNNTVYGTEFSINSGFSWFFFIPAKNPSKAFFKGNFLLNYLKGKFPGLDGRVEVLPLYSDIINFKRNLFELVLPRPRESYFRRIKLLKTFINLYYFRMNKKPVSMYILWQKDDSITSIDAATTKKTSNIFKIRIFFSADIKTEAIGEMRDDELELYSHLKCLTAEIQNQQDECAELIKIPGNMWKNMLEGNIFWENVRNTLTGPFLERKYHEIPYEFRPGFLSPNVTDFTILKNIPLPKSFHIENENIHFADNEHQIHFGKYVRDGVLTNVDTYLPIDNFAQSTLIVGQQGTGKTYLINQLLKEFKDKAPDVGILVLSLAKGNQEQLYPVDTIIKFGTPAFKVPYFVEGHPDHAEKSLQETASYLIASLGLKNVVEKNMLTVMRSCHYNQGLPTSLKILFNNLSEYFKKREYHEKFQQNILRALNNRITSLLDDPILEKTIQLTPDIPEWYQDWLNGKNVFLDLSMCNVYVKRLLANAIFQMTRALIPDIEIGTLQHIILLDEAHQILEKILSNNPDDDDYISKEQLEKIFTNLLRVFRSKGLAFIISDQIPHRLFESATTLPSLKILFRLGYPDNIIFSNDNNELNLLSSLEKRIALMVNGNTGEKYAFKTLNQNLNEYTIKTPHKQHKKD